MGILAEYLVRAEFMRRTKEGKTFVVEPMSVKSFFTLIDTLTGMQDEFLERCAEEEKGKR